MTLKECAVLLCCASLVLAAPRVKRDTMMESNPYGMAGEEKEAKSLPMMIDDKPKMEMMRMERVEMKKPEMVIPKLEMHEMLKSDMLMKPKMNAMEMRSSDMHMMPKMDTLEMKRSDMHMMPKMGMMEIKKSEVHMMPKMDMMEIKRSDMHMMPKMDMMEMKRSDMHMMPKMDMMEIKRSDMHMMPKMDMKRTDMMMPRTEFKKHEMLWPRMDLKKTDMLMAPRLDSRLEGLKLTDMHLRRPDEMMMHHMRVHDDLGMGILEKEQIVNPDGYEYRYKTDSGIDVFEKGHLMPSARSGMGEPSGGMAVEGAYMFTAPDGAIFKVEYIADELGYHPKFTMLGHGKL